MRKYPSDVSKSENRIDANLEIVKRRDSDNFPRFPQQEWCTWTIPNIVCNVTTDTWAIWIVFIFCNLMLHFINNGKKWCLVFKLMYFYIRIRHNTPLFSTNVQNQSRDLDDWYSNLFLKAYINRHAHTEYINLKLI